MKITDTNQRQYEITNIDDADRIIAYLFQHTTDFQAPVIGSEKRSSPCE